MCYKIIKVILAPTVTDWLSGSHQGCVLGPKYTFKQCVKQMKKMNPKKNHNLPFWWSWVGLKFGSYWILEAN